MASVFQDLPRLIEELEVEPRHLVHVGAHQGEEMSFYRQAGIRHITLVEAIPYLADVLRQRFPEQPEVDVINVAVGRKRSQGTLSIMGKTNLSTLVQPGRSDNVKRQIVVDVVPLSEIQADANIAVIDVQGKELDVIAGTNFESPLELMFVEASTVRDPTMSATYDDVVEAMDAVGFKEVNKWSRDYQWINRWGRGLKARFNRGNGHVYDVAFMRG